MPQNLFKPGKYGVFSAERALSEKQIKDCFVFVSSALPVRICHGELIQVR